jgi:homeobox protein cut-like
MAQRDRLRARCDTMEAERDSFKRESQVQVQTAESLKTDNTKLYEKVRYLQTFNSGSNKSGSAYSRGGKSDRDLDLEAFEQRYEASVDPFRQFSRAERLRKFNEISPMERIVSLCN